MAPQPRIIRLDISPAGKEENRRWAFSEEYFNTPDRLKGPGMKKACYWYRRPAQT